MTLIANRYEVLEKLGEGGMGVVHLAYDKLRKQHLALKQVLVADTKQHLAITREFRTLSLLRHPNIVSVIDYGSHDNKPYFTMEYIPDALPLDKSEEQKLEHFIQILQALSYLHRRGILHRDLKPANVLVTSQGLVKVLDFGLARDYMKSKAPGEVAGTLYYLDPEILSEKPPTIGSDLWPVGVMLCEALSGHHPFDNSSPMKLFLSIAEGAPRLEDMNPALASVVARLLEKDPAKRYSGAQTVIQDLADVSKIAIPVEAGAYQESFLQAAAFVGRDKEYQNLVNALKTARDGKQQIWLIGGVAGLGKSRLLDELRTQAMVEGFKVLQGQAAEGVGLPYQLWREPGRELVFGTPISDLNASVLKEIVPDIASLLEREIPDAPLLEPKASRDRLMATICERIRAIEDPLLIILEDLHWASDSLSLLQLLLPQLDKMPVMIVGSYRTDETPKLPELFPTAHLLQLERLNLAAVAALSASMIGTENASHELVERLNQETEGNALFMVEVMRALAEEAGSIYKISHKSLPEKIFAGGMLAVLKRRLQKLPPSALDILKLAALFGRKIDLAVLKALGTSELDQWLQICADAAVLEPYQGEWRFSHNRLCEVLLQDIDELPTLHEKLAQAIELVYPDNVAYAAALAQHWRMAGNPEREVAYILKAAQHFIEIKGDYTGAEKLVKRGLELNLPETLPELLLLFGHAAERRAQFPEAEAAYHEALNASPSLAVRGSIMVRIGTVCWRLSNYAEAIQYAEETQEIAIKLANMLVIEQSFLLLGNVKLAQGEYHQAASYYENCLTVGRDIGDKLGLAMCLNNMGTLAKAQAEYTKARTYFESGLELQREVGNRHGIAMCLNNLGLIAHFQGDNRTAQNYYESGLTIQREIGDKLGIAISLFNLAGLLRSNGDFAAAYSFYESGIEISREIGDQIGVAMCLNGLGNTKLCLGDYTTARSFYESSLKVSREINERMLIATSQEKLGIVAYCEGNYEAAKSLFETALAIGREIREGDTTVAAATGLLIILLPKDRETAQKLLVESLQAVQELDITMMQLTLLGAAYWVNNLEQAAIWSGLILKDAPEDFKSDPRLKSLVASLRTQLGEEAFERAIKKGASLDIGVTIKDLLHELSAA